MAQDFDQAEYRRLKSNLTRAINSNDVEKVISVADHGLAQFDRIGFPDDWSRWERAKNDALFAKQRGKTTLRD